VHFLAPLFVAFTALAAVPVIIHLVGRSRARVRPFPMMEFLVRAHRQVARRTRLRQILLLLLRAAVMAAVPLCLAKPFIETASELPPQVSGAQSAVLIIDDSLAMNYRLGGSPLLQRAKARAVTLLGALGSSAEAALVLASRGAQVPAQVPELTTDRARIVRAIAQIGPSYRPVDLQAALKRAAQLLQSGKSGLRRIYLLSPLTAHALDGGVAAPPGVEVVPVDIADGRPLPNRAVVDLHVDPAPGLGPNGARITAEIANHADEAIKELEVTLLQDGRKVARGLLDLPARGRAVKRFYHVLSAERAEGPEKGEGERGRRADRARELAAGLHDITVQLQPDPLEVDDQRHLRVEVQRRLRVLLIDGDPRSLRREDEVFYLETALRPGEREDSPIDVTTSAVEDLPRRALKEYDAVFLCNVKIQELSRTGQERALVAYVRAGGGLFIALGDNVDADAYNGALADLLPQPLSGTRTAGPVRRPGEEPEARETAQSGSGERLGRLDRRHPLLLPFATGHAAEGLHEARFFRYMLLRPTPRPSGEPAAGAAVDVLLSYDTGAPALVEKPLGKGKVLLLTSTVDRDWNDLPIQPAFLPLMQQAVRYLARAPMRDPEPPALIGQRHEIKLREDDTRVEVTLPSGQKRLFERERLVGRRVLGFTDTDEPGLYRVAAAGADRLLRPRPGEFFVVNVDPAESDLRRAPPQRIEALARPLQGAGEQKGRPLRRVELWHALGALLLCLLLGEALLLREK
jgi:hypothetical protein